MDVLAVAGFVLGLAVSVFGYFLPTILAYGHKQVPNFGSIFVVNLFLGWTFIGWVVALAYGGA
jgi:hypothetical protein